MIFEIAVIGVCVGIFGILQSDRSDIKKTFDDVMHNLGIQNKDNQSMTISRCKTEDYGVKCTVLIPNGLNSSKLIDVKDALETAFNSRIDIESKKGTDSATLKIYEKISMETETKLKFNDIMNDTGIKNSSGATFEVINIVKQDGYGYDLELSIPNGLSPSVLIKNKETLEYNLGAIIDFKTNKLNKELKLMVCNKDIDKQEKFVPIQVNPWELYLAQTYFRNPIIANMLDYAHLLITGSTGTGKTSSLFTAIVNLLHWNDEKTVNLWLAQVSDKRDLAKFKNCKHTQYFSYTLDKTLQMFLHLKNIMKERNKTITELNINNINDYNEKNINKWAYHYIVIDEFSRFMPEENKEIDPFYNVKKKILVELTHLIKEGRNTGIFTIASVQRTCTLNIPAQMKSQFNSKLNFRQMNLASAKTVCDDDSVLNLENREAVFEDTTRSYVKTKYIDDAIIENYLKKINVKDKQYVNIYYDKK